MRYDSRIDRRNHDNGKCTFYFVCGISFHSDGRLQPDHDLGVNLWASLILVGCCGTFSLLITTVLCDEVTLEVCEWLY